MITDEDKAVLKEAVDRWGSEGQLLMVLEEMSELQKEVLKNINRGKDNLPEIIEETADVQIMLEQLKHIYGIEDAVDAYIPKKIERLRKKLKG